jgi:hypothetical protein
MAVCRRVGFLDVAWSPWGIAPHRRFARLVVAARAVHRVRITRRFVVPFVTLRLLCEAL